MPNAPRRARFQIHLSTAIVMMFVAGGIIWVNSLPRFVRYEAYRNPHPTKPGLIERGWPFRVHSVPGWSVPGEPYHLGHWTVHDAGGGLQTLETGINGNQPPTGTFLLPGLASDAAIALAILFFVAFLCEWLIRRRAARKVA